MNNLRLGLSSLVFAALCASGCGVVLGLGDYHEGCADGSLAQDGVCPTSATSSGASVSGSGSLSTSVTGATSNASASVSSGVTSSSTGVLDCGAQTACGTSCVDLDSSGDNCNACDHSCGGGMCMNGVCQPDTIASGISGLHAVGVDSTSIYFSADELVQTCLKNGTCAGAALTTLADFSGQNYDGTGALTAAEGLLVYAGGTSGHPHTSACTTPGCASPQTIGGGYGIDHQFDNTGIVITGAGTAFTVYVYDSQGGIESADCTNGTCANLSIQQARANSASPITATASHYYYQKKTSNVLGGIVRCPVTEPTCATVQDISSASSGLSRLVATTDRLYILWAGGQAGGSAIGYCPIDGCVGAGAPTMVRSTIGTFADMTADDTEVFWVDGDKIRTCTYNACTAPKDLATGLNAPTNLVTDDKFVYWIEGGNTIRRVAR